MAVRHWVLLFRALARSSACPCRCTCRPLSSSSSSSSSSCSLLHASSSSPMIWSCTSCSYRKSSGSRWTLGSTSTGWSSPPTSSTPALARHNKAPRALRLMRRPCDAGLSRKDWWKAMARVLVDSASSSSSSSATSGEDARDDRDWLDRDEWKEAELEPDGVPCRGTTKGRRVIRLSRMAVAVAPLGQGEDMSQRGGWRTGVGLAGTIAYGTARM